MTQSPPTGELVARLREHRNEPMHHFEDHFNRADDLMQEAADAINTLERELEEARALSERLKMEAQGHAMEARTANSTIYEIYQVLSGGRGEPGNWNGAEPARRYVTASQAEVERLKAALKQVVADYDACSGAEPSLSVLHRSIDLVARAALQVEESKG